MGDRVAVMSHGRLQQVDTPQRLYDTPANLFVAGFIGTPPMNLLAATVVSDNGSLAIDARRPAVPALGGGAEALPAGPRDGGARPIVLGIRADDLHPASKRPDLPAIHADLELIEALGSTSIAYFRIDALVIGVDEDLEEEEAEGEGVTAKRPNLVASFQPEEAVGLRMGEKMSVGVDTKHIHLFDAESGEPIR